MNNNKIKQHLIESERFFVEEFTLGEESIYLNTESLAQEIKTFLKDQQTTLLKIVMEEVKKVIKTNTSDIYKEDGNICACDDPCNCRSWFNDLEEILKELNNKGYHRDCEIICKK